MSSITWKAQTQTPATVTSSSTDSATSASTASGATATGAGASAYVDPRMALDQSSFDAKKPVTAAQAGHKLLASKPPLPSDGVNMNSETRALATAAQQKLHSVGSAFGQGHAAGVAQALGSNPNHGIERDSTDLGGDDGTDINPYGNNTDSSPMSVPTDSSGGMDPTTSTVYAGTGTTGSSTTGTDSAPTNSQAQDAANQVLSDANKGGSCGHDSMQQDLNKDRMAQDGLSGDEVNWVQDQMTSNSAGSGQLLADAIVAMEMNPNMKPQILGAISTMTNTQSQITTDSGPSATGVVTSYDQAAQTLASLVNQAGFSNTGGGADAFVIGASQPLPPTQGQNGWTIWQPETET